jgi:hypothetical protein
MKADPRMTLHPNPSERHRRGRDLNGLRHSGHQHLIHDRVRVPPLRVDEHLAHRATEGQRRDAGAEQVVAVNEDVGRASEHGERHQGRS